VKGNYRAGDEIMEIKSHMCFGKGIEFEKAATHHIPIVNYEGLSEALKRTLEHHSHHFKAQTASTDVPSVAHHLQDPVCGLFSTHGNNSKPQTESLLLLQLADVSGSNRENDVYATGQKDTYDMYFHSMYVCHSELSMYVNETTISNNTMRK
jgi:hypothetical protein